MSKIYKTAKGKMVDIDKIKLANETSISVGNMRVNARGDLLGSGTQIAAGRNQIMDRIYAVEDGGYSPNDPAVVAQREKLLAESNARQLNDLANSLTVTTNNNESPTEIPSTTPAARGSLASSIAKPTTVTQEPLKTPQEKIKSNGPSRI